MIKNITLFRIFIASPSGLEQERKIIRKAIANISSLLLEKKIILEAVGWEDVPPDSGRPQEIINEYIDNCDFAIFLWHDKWGSPSGKCSSGTEEEFYKVKQLYGEKSIKGFSVYFKEIDKEENDDIRKIIEFRDSLTKLKITFFKDFNNEEEFERLILKNLQNWFLINKEIEENFLKYKIDDQDFLKKLAEEIEDNAKNIDPKFLFCTEEIRAIYKADNCDYEAAIVFSKTAIKLAKKDNEYAYALNLLATAQFDAKDFNGVIQNCDKISEIFRNSREIKKQIYHLRATLKKLMILSMQGRIDEYLESVSRTLDEFPNDLLESSDELIKIKTDLFNKKGRILAHLKKISDAKKEFENAIDCISQLPKDKDDQLSQYNRFSCSLDLGHALSDLGDYDKADSIYEKMLQDYTTENIIETKNGLIGHIIPSILFNRAINFQRKGAEEECLSILDKIINDYSNSDDIFTYLKVVDAYSIKGRILSEKQEYSKALDNSREFFRLYENKKNNTENETLDLDVIEEDIVRLYAMEADALTNLNRKQESKEKILLILNKFKKSQIKSTKLIIAKGYESLIKFLYEENDIDKALIFINKFEQSFRVIKNILETETVINIFGYKVNCLLKKGNKKEAMEIFDRGVPHYLNS